MYLTASSHRSARAGQDLGRRHALTIDRLAALEGAGPDRIAPGQFLQVITQHFLLYERFNATSCGGRAVERIRKGLTFFEITEKRVGALVQCGLEHFGIPPVHEIAVETVPDHITHCEYPVFLTRIGLLLSIEDELVEEGDELDGVRGGTVARVGHGTGGIGHVRLMIFRIGVFAVPAAGKHDLSA